MIANLNQLRIFHAVAESGSFTRAAETMHLTQPGISKHVKQLEQYYGLSLFDRLGRQVVLTEAGKILFETTREIFSSITGAEQRIKELNSPAGGSLFLGASFTVGIYMMPEILAAFRQKYPAVKATLEISLSEEVEAKVLANTLDIGLIGHTVSNPKLVSKHLATDELVVILSGTHKWAAKKYLRPQELVNEPFILATKGSGTRVVVEEHLRRQGVSLNIVEFGNTEGVKKAVEAGLGVSILSKSVVQRELSIGTLVAVHLAGMKMKKEYAYIYRKGKYQSNAAKAFLEMLQIRAGGRVTARQKSSSTNISPLNPE